MKITITVTKKPVMLSTDGLWVAEAEHRTIDRGYIVRASGSSACYNNDRNGPNMRMQIKAAVQEAVEDLFDRMDFYGE